MSARAGIVVTGTEVLTGRVQDANGPWLADRLLELGVELAHITICGDRPSDIEAQLRFLAGEGVDLIITSGGLGPTADDMTVATVASFCGRDLVLDAALESTIADILKRMVDRSQSTTVDFDAVMAANRKQAMVPAGAEILGPVGTAPGVVVPGSAGRSEATGGDGSAGRSEATGGDGSAGRSEATGGEATGGSNQPTVVVLPGPPRELQPMWDKAIRTTLVQEAIVGRTEFVQDTIRMFGLPESGLAETLRDGEGAIGGFDRLEITTCLRRGELEIVTRYEPDAAPVYADLVALLRERHGRQLFSEDGSLVDDQIARLLAGRTIATAESCTAGMVAARLTDRAGSSDYVAGGVVSYSNEAKMELLGVDAGLLGAHGAVSEPVAEAMAAGALRRFGADTAIATTGIAGPGGGSAEKPVGTVCFSVRLAEGPMLTQTLLLPGNRSDVRERSTTVAMHLLRRILSQHRDAE